MTLYVSDLDGTLLKNNATLSERTVSTLNRLMAQGVKFSYATARSFASASPILKELHITCPAVIFNGVFVVDPVTGKRLVENVPDEAALSLAVEFFTENRLAPLVYSFVGGKERVSYLESRYDEVKSYVDSRKGDPRLRPVKGYKQLFAGKMFYFTMLDYKGDIPALYERFSRENGFTLNITPDTYDNSVWYEICSSSASEAAAVMQTMRLTGADELVCFGDNRNDISMILTADVGVAVSNAHEELIANADMVTGSNEEDAVAEFIAARERPQNGGDKFSEALGAAMMRVRGMHGSVGTQNEKLIHATLKNYYCPAESGQEIKIGKFFADAVNEEGIYEIQTRSLFRLKEKLEVFTSAASVNIVHPVEAVTRTVYINTDTGEVAQESAWRRAIPKMRIFEELYSIRDYLPMGNVTVILPLLKVEKRVYFSGKLPDLRLRNERKRTEKEKIPLELTEEIRLSTPMDYMRYLPKGLPEQFTKAEFCKLCKEPSCSLRLEVLRTMGLLVQTGTKGKRYVYSLSDKI